MSIESKNQLRRSPDRLAESVVPDAELQFRQAFPLLRTAPPRYSGWRFSLFPDAFFVSG
jgi:hypothetical protein